MLFDHFRARSPGATRRPMCSCCNAGSRVWIGDPNGTTVRIRVCLHCDSPLIEGWPQGFDPATWEINQRARERGEMPWGSKGSGA